MMNKIFLFLFALGALKATGQAIDEGYIDHAVPMFDNETREVDMGALQVLPIILYQGQTPNNNGSPSTTASNAVVDLTDVQVFPSATAQHEQHMTLSHIFPGNIIMSSNAGGNQGYYVSQDGGTTWTGSNSIPDATSTAGDPSTAIDGVGTLLLQAMTSGTTGYKVFQSSTQGTSWGASVSYTYATVDFDKNMMAVDDISTSPYYGYIYTAWSDFTASPYKVKFNRSINGGASYLANINLHNSWGQGTNVQTGVNGEVYVCWANYSTGGYPSNGMGFSYSANGGSSFTDLTPVFTYTGIRPNNVGNPLFNNTRVNDFPSMAVDKSCGQYRGRIYIANAVKQNGNGKAVITVHHSDNNGSNWTNDGEVSIASGRQNWFPWITVDDATGTVSVAYLTFDTPSGFTTNTYLAYSFDGGANWSNIKVSDVGHTVASIPGYASGYCGDYIGNTAWGNKNYVAWNDNRGTQWNNYVSEVDFARVVLFSDNSNLQLNGPVDLTLPTASEDYYQSTGSITTPIGSTFKVENGAFAEMKAATYVDLKVGFQAFNGSHFKAYTGSVSSCLNASASPGQARIIDPELLPAYTGDASVQFQFYPNPANSEVNFQYLLPDYSKVTIELYTLEGIRVRTLVASEDQEPGNHIATFDINNLAAGTYLFRISTSNFTKSGRFIKIN